jgi:hypothetical protein
VGAISPKHGTLIFEEIAEAGRSLSPSSPSSALRQVVKPRKDFHPFSWSRLADLIWEMSFLPRGKEQGTSDTEESKQTGLAEFSPLSSYYTILLHTTHSIKPSTKWVYPFLWVFISLWRFLCHVKLKLNTSVSSSLSLFCSAGDFTRALYMLGKGFAAELHF